MTNLPSKVGLAEGARGPDVADLRAYLARYGYLRADPRKVAADLDAEFDRATTEALTRYQRFFHLPVTGRLDTATVEMMARPRCGMPDVEPRPDGAATVDDEAPEEYVTQGSKWTTNDLKYGFTNHTGDLTVAQVEQAVSSALSLWAGVTPLTFTKVDPSQSPEILIQFAPGDHGDGFPFDGTGGTLAHAFSPPPARTDSLAGDAHFDDAESWAVDGNAYDLLTVAAHEFGHSLGLRHSDVSTALMWPSYTGIHRYLDADDVAGIQAVYGPPPPPPDPPTNVTATALSVSEIRVAWSPAARAASYQVRVADSQSGPWQALGPPTVATSYVHAGLAPNTSRFYSVQSISSAGAVADSTNIALGLTWPATPPAAPTGVAAVVRGASGAVPLAVELTWAPTYRAERYQVVVAGVPSHEFRARGPTAFHWYTDPLVRAGHASWPAAPQQFTVRAVNGYGASVDSATVSVSVPRAP